LFVSTFIAVNLTQPPKELVPMLVTLAGIEMLVRVKQYGAVAKRQHRAQAIFTCDSCAGKGRPEQESVPDWTY
jgi:hypothetical protein